MEVLKGEKKENKFIYLCKLFAAFLVVTLHTHVPYKCGIYVTGIARAAVPFFFAVSGRYLLSGVSKDAKSIRTKTKASLKKLSVLTLKVWLIYTAFSLIYHNTLDYKLSDWVTEKFNFKEALWFILFNSGEFIYDRSYTIDHLWFLFALIYVYIFVIVFAGVLRKIAKPLIVILLGILFWGEWLRVYYPVKLFGISVSTWYVLRNWLFVGIPFTLIGIVFSDYIEKLREDKNYEVILRRFRLPSVFLFILGIVFSVIGPEEYLTAEVNFGSVLLVVSILFLSEQNFNCGKYLWKAGKRYSSAIYFYHVLVIAVFYILCSKEIIPFTDMGTNMSVVLLTCVVLFIVVPEIFRLIRKKA